MTEQAQRPLDKSIMAFCFTQRPIFTACCPGSVCHVRVEDVSNLASTADYGEMIRVEEIGGLKLSAWTSWAPHALSVSLLWDFQAKPWSEGAASLSHSLRPPEPGWCSGHTLSVQWLSIC